MLKDFVWTDVSLKLWLHIVSLALSSVPYFSTITCPVTLVSHVSSLFLYLLISLSLVSVLNQLPLPSPLPATTTKSLLYNGRIAEEVTCLLGCRDENLASQLAHGLNQVSTEHMWVFRWNCISDKIVSWSITESQTLYKAAHLPENRWLSVLELEVRHNSALNMISKNTMLFLTYANSDVAFFFTNWNIKRFIFNEIKTQKTLQLRINVKALPAGKLDASTTYWKVKSC